MDPADIVAIKSYLIWMTFSSTINISKGTRMWIGQALFSDKKGTLSTNLKLWWEPSVDCNGQTSVICCTNKARDRPYMKHWDTGCTVYTSTNVDRARKASYNTCISLSGV